MQSILKIANIFFSCLMSSNPGSQKIRLKVKARLQGFLAPPFLVCFCTTLVGPVVRKIKQRGVGCDWMIRNRHRVWQEDCIGLVTRAGLGFFWPCTNC